MPDWGFERRHLISSITGAIESQRLLSSKMLRILPRRLLVLFPIFAVAQTADDLTARYGSPDAEKFLVRPEIMMTAEYSEDYAACEMLIEPRNSKQHQSTKEPSMATVVVSEIIDELISRSQRGIFLNHLIENMGAAEHQVFEYQNVAISRNFVRYRSIILIGYYAAVEVAA